MGYESKKVGAKEVISFVVFGPVIILQAITTAVYCLCLGLVCALFHRHEFKNRYNKNIKYFIKKTWKE